LRAATRISKKSEYNTQVFAGTLVDIRHSQSWARALNASRFRMIRSGEF
jgi:hypothetical protein